MTLWLILEVNLFNKMIEMQVSLKLICVNVLCCHAWVACFFVIHGDCLKG